jgi:hypothetical protein
MGINIKMTWKGSTEAERRERDRLIADAFGEWAEGWAAHAANVPGKGRTALGHLGYLYEGYHGDPYATRILVPEAFNSDSRQARIPAAAMRSRLREAMAASRQRAKAFYGDETGALGEAMAKGSARIEPSRQKGRVMYKQRIQVDIKIKTDVVAGEAGGDGQAQLAKAVERAKEYVQGIEYVPCTKEVEISARKGLNTYISYDVELGGYAFGGRTEVVKDLTEDAVRKKHNTEMMLLTSRLVDEVCNSSITPPYRMVGVMDGKVCMDVTISSDGRPIIPYPAMPTSDMIITITGSNENTMRATIVSESEKRTMNLIFEQANEDRREAEWREAYREYLEKKESAKQQPSDSQPPQAPQDENSN